MERNSESPVAGSHRTEPIDWDDDAQIDRAVRLAIVDTLREHKAKGQYVVGLKDGRVVEIPAEEIVVPEID
jgi:hypothetical protein